MMISIIIIVPPLRNRSGKNADRYFYNVHLARTAAAARARACLSLFSKGLEGRSQSELDFVMTT